MSELPDPTAPEQVGVITIGTDEPLLNYAKEIVTELRAQGVRVAGDFGTDPMQAKIAEAEKLRGHTMLVIGGRDMDAGAVAFRPAWQRQRWHQAEGGSHCRHSGEYQRAKGVKTAVQFRVREI